MVLSAADPAVDADRQRLWRDRIEQRGPALSELPLLAREFSLG
jgi:hypothetical protein